MASAIITIKNFDMHTFVDALSRDLLDIVLREIPVTPITEVTVTVHGTILSHSSKFSPDESPEDDGNPLRSTQNVYDTYSDQNGPMIQDGNGNSHAKCVLQDWVSELPLRHQGVILTCVRGCDLAPKTLDTLNSPERVLVAFFRYCTLNPYDEREIDDGRSRDKLGSFFRSVPPYNFKFSSIGHYPLHWVSHIMHGFQIVAHYHPDSNIRREADKIYKKCVTGLHLNVETREEMDTRLTEDRVSNGRIVS